MQRWVAISCLRAMCMTPFLWNSIVKVGETIPGPLLLSNLFSEHSAINRFPERRFPCLSVQIVYKEMKRDEKLYNSSINLKQLKSRS